MVDITITTNYTENVFDFAYNSQYNIDICRYRVTTTSATKNKNMKLPVKR
jgi:hypothetical protein